MCSSESGILQKNPLASNINIPEYNIEYSPTEPAAGVPLMYISQILEYEVRKDLWIYSLRELEPVFL